MKQHKRQPTAPMGKSALDAAQFDHGRAGSPFAASTRDVEVGLV